MYVSYINSVNHPIYTVADDFEPQSGTWIFTDAEQTTPQCIDIAIVNDVLVEDMEQLIVELSAPSQPDSADLTLNPGTATVLIIDTDRM